jgi:hypothetical protein
VAYKLINSADVKLFAIYRLVYTILINFSFIGVVFPDIATKYNLKPLQIPSSVIDRRLLNDLINKTELSTRASVSIRTHQGALPKFYILTIKLKIRLQFIGKWKIRLQSIFLRVLRTVSVLLTCLNKARSVVVLVFLIAIEINSVDITQA